MIDTALLLEAEKLKMSQDHEVILADHRQLEPGKVMGLGGRRHGSWGPGTGRGGSDQECNLHNYNDKIYELAFLNSSFLCQFRNWLQTFVYGPW